MGTRRTTAAAAAGAGIAGADGTPDDAARDDASARAAPGPVTPSFREFATARRAALRRTAYLMCGDWHLADDVVQDALARLYADWPRLAGRGPVEAYARKVVVNGVLAHRRRPWRREVAAPALPDVPDPRSGDGAPAGADDGTRDVLLRALAGLGASQRAVVVLRYWDDLPVDEVARVLGCSTGNVKSQAARGLAHLRDALGARPDQEVTP
nr:SigE family RNA polymerase sigma factor [Kineosporia sp. A_224]